MRDIMDTGVSFHPPVEEREFTPIVTGHIKISFNLHLRDFEICFIIQNLSSFLNILEKESFSTQNR